MTSTSCLVSLLPSPTEPLPGSDLDDSTIVLLAGTAHVNGLFGYDRYCLVQEACRQIFGEKILHARLQAKLHYSLLHPLSPDALEKTARLVAEHVRTQGLPEQRLMAIFKAAEHVLANTATPENTLSASSSIFLSRLHAALNLPTEGKPHAPTAPKTVGQRLTALCRIPTRRASTPHHMESGSYTVPSMPSDIAPGIAPQVARLEQFAELLQNDALQTQLRAFQTILPRRPFRVVLAGERKRGKSTLLNALLGQVVSPVREAVPMTSTVAMFHDARLFSAKIHCLSPEDLALLAKRLDADPEDVLLRRSLERLQKNFAASGLEPGQSRVLGSLEELREALRSDGPFSGLLARVEVGLPGMPFGKNLVIVDTPGLNDTDPLLSGLALDAGLSADCVVFVMDARDPASASELHLLRRLVTLGRGITVVGALTHGDLIHDLANLNAAREQTKTILEEACRASKQVRLARVVTLNARQAMLERCRDNGKKEVSSACGEFPALVRTLYEAMTESADPSRRQAKIRDSFSRLQENMNLALRNHAEVASSRMPGPELLSMLKAHSAQLAEATRLSVDQARQMIEIAQADLEAWEKETNRALDKFQETLVLRLMEAVNHTIAESGHGFAKNTLWRKFDNEEAKAIAKRSVDEFLAEQGDVLADKEKRLRLFAREMDVCAQTCLATATATLEGIENDGGFMKTGDRRDATNFLVQTHHYMKQLAIFSGGAALGRITAVGPLALIISVGNMIALSIASPMIAVVMAAVAGTAGVLYHLGREDKRRSALIERRRKEAEQYAARITDALRAEIDKARGYVEELYADEIRNGFSPAIESLFHQSAHLRLFLDTMDTIRNTVVKREQEGQRQLAALAEMLSQQETKSDQG